VNRNKRSFERARKKIGGYVHFNKESVQNTGSNDFQLKIEMIQKKLSPSPFEKGYCPLYFLAK